MLVFVSDGGEEAVARLPPRHRHRLLRPHLLRGGLGHHPDQVHPREYLVQGDYDGRGQQTASPMFTAIMSGGVGISGRESANTAE